MLKRLALEVAGAVKSPRLSGDLVPQHDGSSEFGESDGKGLVDRDRLEG